MHDIALYCKSYRQDIRRAHVLATSVAQFNTARLPFYMSVPTGDLAMFRDKLSGLPVELLDDRAIVAASPGLDDKRIAAMPGGRAQQTVKAQFWRLQLAANYLCVDSDCKFLRDFSRNDFLAPDGHPYTIVHECKELLQFASTHGLAKVPVHYVEERRKIMEIFSRTGRAYDFGPAPLIWSAAVWRALDEQFLASKGMNFCDAIELFPSEILWYGEALLKYRPIPLWPIEPLFRCFHYRAQFRAARRQGTSERTIAQNYLGVVYQSNWHRALDLENRWVQRWRRLRQAVGASRVRTNDSD